MAFQLERIKKRKYFMAAAASGLKAVSGGLILQASPNLLPDNPTRVGFTTTKKLGHAVIRNRIRRRLREVVRLNFGSKGLAGFDYVVIGRKSSLDKNFSDLCQDLNLALKTIQQQVEQTQSLGQKIGGQDAFIKQSMSKKKKAKRRFLKNLKNKKSI